MKHPLAHGALLGVAVLFASSQAFGQPPRAAAEVVNTLEAWSEEDSYIVVGGRRYPVDGAVEVVDRNGRPLVMDALRRGASVGILEENGRVTKVVIFDY